MAQTVLHVISGLNDGGAEAVLNRLCMVSQDNFRHCVVSMLGMGKYGPVMRKQGISVHALNCGNFRSVMLAPFRLMRIIRTVNPDIVQTWMYHANLLGGLAAKCAGCAVVVWGIRHTRLDGDKRTTRMVSWLCARLSRKIPRAIVCCSDSAARIHVQYGYDAGKMTVIHNGYNLDMFTRSLDMRIRSRREFGVRDDQLLLGMVGRWNAEKDHANLLQALVLLRNSRPGFICLLVGPRMTMDNGDLVALIAREGLQDCVRLIGRRDDIPAIMNALDLHVLSSMGEAFPNVVAEAMACGTPCVVTDVGDAAVIVGNPDWVVPPRRPDLLAEAITRALISITIEGRDAVGRRCRERIVEKFDLARMAQSYKDLWTSIKAG